MMENEYRLTFCPGMDAVFCECPFASPVCEGSWTCADIAEITNDILFVFDDNEDGAINIEDVIGEEHLGVFLDSCDYNNDGTID